MFLLAAAIAAAPPPKITIVLGSVQLPHSTAKCLRVDSHFADTESRYSGKPLAPRRLTELPPANLYVAVMRVNESGCLDPIVVKYNIGR